MQHNAAHEIPMGPCAVKAQDVKVITDDLRRLVKRYANVVGEESRKHMNTLELETNTCNAEENDKLISHSGSELLAELRDRLKLTVDEMQRLDSEGGIPVTDEEAEKEEALLKIIRRIEGILDHKHLSH